MMSMNDRYLYSAKRTDNGEWVEGCLLIIDDSEYRIATSCLQGDVKELLNVCAYEVDQSTICQCTEINDKNGKLIWENDIVKGKYYDNGKSHRHIGQVKYIYEAYKVVGVKQYTGYHAHLDGSYEVIGNIFDNKELLEREDKNENNY